MHPDEWKKKQHEKDRNRATFKLRLQYWAWFLELGPDGKKISKLYAVDEEGRTRFDSTRKTQRLETAPNPRSDPKHQAVVKAQDRDPAALPPPIHDKEKKWLDVMEPGTKSFSSEWLNVIKGISSGVITNVDDVRKYYKVNKREAAKIKDLLTQ